MFKRFFKYLDHSANGWDSKYSELEIFMSRATIVVICLSVLFTLILGLVFGFKLFGWGFLVALGMTPIIYSLRKAMKHD